jgi:hypothetical protein
MFHFFNIVFWLLKISKKHLISERLIFNIDFWLYIASQKKRWLAVSAEDGRLLGGDPVGMALGVIVSSGSRSVRGRKRSIEQHAWRFHLST